MKFLFSALSFLLLTVTVSAQKALEKIISVSEAERIEKMLSSDDMMGRRTFSPGIEKAAVFIESEFKAAGLQPVSGNSYQQKFALVRPRFLELQAISGDTPVEAKNVIVVTTQPELSITEKSGYEVKQIKAGDNLFNSARGIMQSGKNTLVLVDGSLSANFGRLTGLKRSLFSMNHSVIFILGEFSTGSYKITAKHEISSQPLANVVGILPGKSKKDEYVIFSGHYDHLGTGKAKNGDSIFNGANDDAAGITAVILLAKYFKEQANNERTLVFAAFTAEEIGGFGSQYFSRQYAPEKVMAMFNIEMIGTESKWGANSAYITGFDKTDMGAILQKNLEGSGFTFHPDPYPQQQLFFRSDNATLAALGVPAHTISTSKMDVEQFYHTVDDEVETLNLENMTQIIRSIAISAKTIISGKDTPTRVEMPQGK